MPTFDKPAAPPPSPPEATDLGAQYGRIGLPALAAATRYAGSGRNPVVAAPVPERPPTTDSILLLG